MPPMMQAFERKTGIKVSMTRKSSGEFYAQINARPPTRAATSGWGGTGDPFLCFSGAERRQTESPDKGRRCGV